MSRNRRRELPESVAAGIWDWHLNGDRPGTIARYSYQLFSSGLPHDECTVVEVRNVLASDPPAEILADPRYVHGVNAFWIASGGSLSEGMGDADAFVMVFKPIRMNSNAFQKGVRAVARDFRANCVDGYIHPQVIEGIEVEVALRQVHEKGRAAWIIDEEGGAVRYDGRFEPSEEAVPDGPSL